MKQLPFARHVSAVALALAMTGSFAQPAAGDDALYQALGGEPGIAQLVTRFHDALLADKRTQPFFKDADHKRLVKQLAIQFCEVSGGPCQLQGKDRDMKVKHEGQDVTKNDFNAVVEVLQQAMEAQGLPFATQNRLLAQLAPLHRDIVNARK